MWNVAIQREHKGALEKIQEAMEKLEREVTQEDDGDWEENYLGKIQRVMHKSGGNTGSPLKKVQVELEEDGKDEDLVGLISKL